MDIKIIFRNVIRMSLFHDVIIMFLFSWKLVGANMNIQAMLTQLFRKYFAHSGWWVLSLLLLLMSVMLNIPCLVDINVHVFEVALVIILQFFLTMLWLSRVYVSESSQMFL